MNINDIENPQFLKDLETKELVELSSDIRKFLLDNISKTGGHLSSNLGVVELTVALHKVFDSPNDQIFFDVGHQSYVHKILTGRAKDFPTLRKYKGLSGFIKREESVHDLWESGHASTSLSGALGYTQAKILSGNQSKTIAVIGDASIGGGMALEALNHIGSVGKNVIVVLNDNEMSITSPVGGLSNTLSRVRISSKYRTFKNVVKKSLGKLPFGSKILAKFKKMRRGWKKRMLEEGYFFEDLGISYYGPIDGHDYESLVDMFEFAKKFDGPILVHVKTIKGKGYQYAENDKKGCWHGVGSFNIETGEIASKLPYGHENWSNIIIWTIEDLAITNKDLVVLTPAMESGSMLKKFKKKYPDRYYDVGIAEEHATTMAAGLALGGMHPILSIYSTFLQRSYDQLSHDICRMNTRVIICVDRSGLVGADGSTHNGIYDVAYLKTIPNLVICMPRNADDAQHLLNTCVKYNGPIAIRYPRGSASFNKVSAYKEYTIGEWEEIFDGSEDLVITYGSHVDDMCMYIIENDLDVGMVNARFINPIDFNMLDKLFENYKNIYVYEEVVENNNLYSSIVKYAFEKNVDINIKSYCLPNTFVEHGDVPSLLKQYGLDYETFFDDITKR